MIDQQHSIVVVGYRFREAIIAPSHGGTKTLQQNDGGIGFIASRLREAKLPVSHVIDGYCPDGPPRQRVLELEKCWTFGPDDDPKEAPKEIRGIRQVGWCDGVKDEPDASDSIPAARILVVYDRPADTEAGADGKPKPRHLKNLGATATVVISHDLDQNHRPLSIIFEEWEINSPQTTIVVVDAETIRSAGGCRIRSFSWEAAAQDIADALAKTTRCPVLEHLLGHTNHLLIGLGPHAAVYCQNGAKPRIQLICHRNLSLVFNESPATVFGSCAFLGVGIAEYLASEYVGCLFPPSELPITRAVQHGLCRNVIRCRTGYKSPPKDKTGVPESQSIFKTPVAEAELADTLARQVSPTAQSERRHPWSLLSELWQRRRNGHRKLAIANRIANHVVEQGLKSAAAGNWTRHKWPAPFLFARIGKWIGIDREEIEGYQSLRNLMKSYVLNTSAESPLCLAAFGPPGSGKSTGIRELTASLSGFHLLIEGTALEFNMAEYNEPSGLAQALHVVRDYALRGKVPVAMFDEFDSTLAGRELGWLKYFLAPMQDGKFREGNAVYHTGRAIFVFVGGTKRSFDEFSGQIRNNWFIAAKGPDFVSRLRGHVNVAGLGAIDENADPEEQAMNIVRKAVFLRKFLETRFGIKDESGKIEVEPELLTTLLERAAYRHGVRSLQAIIGMCTINTDDHRLTRSSLPPRGQLDMHLDADHFLRCLDKAILE